MERRPAMLIVDDDRDFVAAAVSLAQMRHFRVVAANSLADARSAIERDEFDLALIDLQLPDGEGFDLVDAMDKSLVRSIAIVTGDHSARTAARAVRRRVDEYLLKPLDSNLYESLLERTSNAWQAGQQHREHISSCGDFVGNTPEMRELYRQLRLVGPTHATVLIVGESGTGKELAARALHEISGRAGELVAVNCGAVAPDLLASQLFGHEKGSFTGAVRQHLGYFERAQRGTLFLDEITEMPLPLQVHLLRVLEERSITRVGGATVRQIDVRVIAATNRNPQEAIAAGRLREDLYFRLADFLLKIPPLRARLDDVPLIAQHMVDALNRRYQGDKYLDTVSLRRLMEHDWPGNVRELGNRIHRAYILAADERAIAIDTSAEADTLLKQTDDVLRVPVGSPLIVAEREMILRTLKHFGGDKVRAAQALGISVKTIYNHLARMEKDTHGSAVHPTHRYDSSL